MPVFMLHMRKGGKCDDHNLMKYLGLHAIPMVDNEPRHWSHSELCSILLFFEKKNNISLAMAHRCDINFKDPDPFLSLSAVPMKGSGKIGISEPRQETNITGVYAPGDICGPPWQMAIAVGQGCIAGLEAAAYAKKFR